MNRFLVCIMHVLVGLLCSVSPQGTAAAESDTDPYADVFAMANGVLIAGTPEWTTTNDTLYLNGQVYYALDSHQPPKGFVVDPQCATAHEVGMAATQAAADAMSRAEWVERFTSALDELGGSIVRGYSISEHVVLVQFSDVASPAHVSIPADYPVRLADPAFETAQDIFAYMKHKASAQLVRGSMIIWGEAYPVHFVPPSLSAKTKQLLQDVYLGAQPGSLDLEGTPFRVWPQMLDDFIRVNREGK